MKKEKFYSIAYAFVLTLILVGTSLSAQYASLNTEKFSFGELETYSPDEVTYNIQALKEISVHLKNQLEFYNEVLELNFSDDAIVQVELAATGEIITAEVINGGNKNLNQIMVNTIKKMDIVTPITRDGEAIAETVYIPVKFR